ncbi:thioredoxin family protein [Alteromonas lipolytica]|uniref:Glutaredoxin n=1 Tax=Alteromonas lipolytica TaxID=1856405 RepID=A0A1E8FFM8_9ALTE|nr:thioredoxin family protein [Alteromonas lipolytica]OFI34742.1 glutaredoxin [Alteromonas lipolytica]GGF53640.1 glutaredoxin [Alteromonas lipolytica]
MKKIMVLGSGCAKCSKTAEQLEKLAQELGVEAEVSKQTDPQVIMQYGVMSTPAVVIDDQIVHTGSIPHTEEIKAWLKR